MAAEKFSKSIIAAAPGSAPGSAAKILRVLMQLAIDGTEGLHGAKMIAAKQLDDSKDAEKAIGVLIRNHMMMAGTQGFLTNIGGFATLLIGTPTNLAGLAIIHIRMVAAVAHLRGYDIEDDRVRHAILTTLLGKSIVADLVSKGELPGDPVMLATSPGLDSELAQSIAQKVLMAMITSVGGKQLVGVLARKIPVIGGGVGLITDSWNTHAVGAYAKEQFISRKIVEEFF